MMEGSIDDLRLQPSKRCMSVVNMWLRIILEGGSFITVSEKSIAPLPKEKRGKL